MKVTFRCKLSGNTVSFTNPLDIECLRKDVNYEEVKDEIKTKTESESIGNHADENEGRDERQEGNDENEVQQEEVLAVQMAVERLLPVKETKKRGRKPKK